MGSESRRFPESAATGKTRRLLASPNGVLSSPLLFNFYKELGPLL
jgi:hypothetical protein